MEAVFCSNVHIIALSMKCSILRFGRYTECLLGCYEHLIYLEQFREHMEKCIFKP